MLLLLLLLVQSSKCLRLALPCMFFTDFKMLLITFKVLHDLAPTFLSDLISVSRSSRYNLRNTDDGILL